MSPKKRRSIGLRQYVRDNDFNTSRLRGREKTLHEKLREASIQEPIPEKPKILRKYTMAERDVMMLHWKRLQLTKDNIARIRGVDHVTSQTLSDVRAARRSLKRRGLIK